jgi:hypothetical protein
MNRDEIDSLRCLSLQRRQARVARLSGATDELKGVPIRPDAKIDTVGTAPIGTPRNLIGNVGVVRYLGDSGSSRPLITLSIRDRRWDKIGY